MTPQKHMKRKPKYIILMCSKCTHLLYKKNDPNWEIVILGMNCPECGEDSEDLWILHGVSNKFPDGAEWLNQSL